MATLNNLIVTGNASFANDVKSSGYYGPGSVEYIVGTQASATNVWTGISKDSALYDGKMIMYVLPVSGTSSGATLNLTLAGGGTTGAKNIYRYGETTAITTHYAAGSRIFLIYDATNSRWNSSAWYYSDTDTKNSAGATDTSSKIFIVGATTQTANPQTYTHDTAYVGTDGCLYSNSTKVSVEGHTHGNITSDGDITATAPTVASGDKIIINDESASKITNGPSFGTSTTTYLRNDGTWGTPSGAVTSVNSKTGAVSLTASDVGALPSSTTIPAQVSKIYTGTCSTAEGTAAKVATLDDATGFSLANGVKVAITFTNGQNATSPTLNVNNTGAYAFAAPVGINSYESSGGTGGVNIVAVGETILFTYKSGTGWIQTPSGYVANNALAWIPLKADKDSPALTGTPTAPTAASETNTTQIATTAFVQQELTPVKTSVSNGKSAIASAITDKGVSTSSSDSFATMASNIRNISGINEIIENNNIVNYPPFSEDISPGTLCRDYGRIAPETTTPVANAGGRNYQLTDNTYIAFNTIYLDGLEYSLFTVADDGRVVSLVYNFSVGGTTTSANTTYNYNCRHIALSRYENTNIYFLTYTSYSTSNNAGYMCVHKFTYNENDNRITYLNSVSTESNLPFYSGSSNHLDEYQLCHTVLQPDYLLLIKPYYKNSSNTYYNWGAYVYLPDSGTGAILSSAYTLSLPADTTYQNICWIKRKSNTEFYCLYSATASFLPHVCTGTFSTTLDGTTRPRFTFSNDGYLNNANASMNGTYSIEPVYLGDKVLFFMTPNGVNFSFTNCYIKVLQVDLSGTTPVITSLLNQNSTTYTDALIKTNVYSSVLTEYKRSSITDFGNGRYMFLVHRANLSSAISNDGFYSVIWGAIINYDGTNCTLAGDLNVIFNSYDNRTNISSLLYCYSCTTKKIDNNSLYIIPSYVSSYHPVLKVSWSDWTRSIYANTSSPLYFTLETITKDNPGATVVFPT